MVFVRKKKCKKRRLIERGNYNKSLEDVEKQLKTSTLKKIEETKKNLIEERIQL